LTFKVERFINARMSFTIAIVLVVCCQVWLVIPFLGPGGYPGTASILIVLALGVLWQIRTGGHWGLSRDALRPAFLKVALLTIPVLLLVYLLGRSLGTVRLSARDLPVLIPLFLWALAQQFVLQTVIFEEARGRWPHFQSVWVAAAVFGVLHLPNPFLAGVTLLAGIGWCSIYRHHPNILPLALSHSVSTFIIVASLPREITGGLRVGYSYLFGG
jgi:membrane protease YdiL (CAAX protease family)